MPVLRKKYKNEYTILPNAILKDQRLSYRDIGLLAWMLSKPQDWKFSYEGMLAERSKDGKSALQTGVKNLQAAGYLRIEKQRHKGRLAERIWYVYDAPYTENPYMEKPYKEKQPQQNTDKTKYMTAEKAVPGSEAGRQPMENLYLDKETGEWRRRI